MTILVDNIFDHYLCKVNIHHMHTNLPSNTNNRVE